MLVAMFVAEPMALDEADLSALRNWLCREFGCSGAANASALSVANMRLLACGVASFQRWASAADAFAKDAVLNEDVRGGPALDALASRALASSASF